MLRLVAMIPGFLLLSLGFWWGHDLWTKLTKGTGTMPAYVLNLPFGQAESADVAGQGWGGLSESQFP